MGERTNGSKGSLQPEAEGSPAPEVAEATSFECAVARRPTFVFPVGLIENALCYLQVGVKKAVHPIRFASDSRIALLTAVSNPPGGDRLPAQAGTILHKVQSVPTAAPFAYQK